MSQQDPTANSVWVAPLRGIGGWLAFLMVCLIVLWLGSSAFLTWVALASVDSAKIDQHVWSLALVEAWGEGALLVIACWTMAALLYFRRVRSTRWIVMGLLWFSAIVPSYAGFAFIKATIPDMARFAMDASTSSVLKGIIQAFAWTLYLAISKRIRNTYV